MLSCEEHCSLPESWGDPVPKVTKTQEIQKIQGLVEEAGLEIYQVHATEIEIAERIRLHIMDSGVRIKVADGLVIRFSARCQRSDFPGESPDALFERVHHAIGIPVQTRGYSEAERRVIEVKDPSDDERMLDVWHEIVFEMPCEESKLIEELRWVLELEKYVGA
ncbi:MAG: hypothetical protein ACI9KE_005675 [Polyangiales bacterium]